jgi:protein-arginine kinase activator protein McsA
MKLDDIHECMSCKRPEAEFPISKVSVMGTMVKLCQNCAGIIEKLRKEGETSPNARLQLETLARFWEIKR